MANFWNLVNNVIRKADILLLVLDSRMADSTRNIEIEDKVREAGKPLIYVMNKCDLVDREYLERYKKKLPNSVFVSAKEHLGTTKLRQIIFVNASKLKIKDIKVGVLGYPNVGKSSIINALRGKGSAPTSSVSGYTKALQNVNVGGNIMLIDTPGVIPYRENDGLKLNVIATIDHIKEKDPDVVAMKLMEEFPGAIEHYYNIEIYDDKEETLEKISKKFNMLLKGNEPDIMRASKKILYDWQTGKIKQK
jgi:ribosome biogenesis GTPase A